LENVSIGKKCKEYGFDVTSKWYDHIPENVIEKPNLQDSLGL